MPLRDDLLTPIPGDLPGGANLRYDPLYDKVKEARREDDDLPAGELPTGPRKTADYALVQRLASEALATKTKDLQLAAWLTEALLNREGFAGLTQGLGLLRDLLVQFWDSLYPELEDDDAELRAAPLDWVGSRLVIAVRQVPLTKAGYGHLKFEESRDVGYEAAVQESTEKAERRQQKIAEGKLAAEDWDRAVESTDLAFYQKLTGDLDAALETLAALDAVSQEKFGDVAPSYTPLREVLEQVRGVARSILTKKLPPEPEPGLDGDGDGTTGNGDGAEGGAVAGVLAGGGRRRAPGGPSLLDLAAAEVRAGRPARAVDMLMAAASRGKSRRDRFIRRTQVAKIMVDAGLFAVAIPLLEQMVSEIDEHKLEDWEPGAIVATPMALLYRCYDRTDFRGSAKDELYLRVCRLDPVQAIALTPSAG
ncbi:MAG TPA: type VI secretion system protein TssA [Gemmatimonadaceae bacterium]|nr:type VI secretion system protein TssA [Gemmatimonadaceae bacterium]